MRRLFENTIVLKVMGIVSVLLGVVWFSHRVIFDGVMSFVIAIACFVVAWMGDHYSVFRCEKYFTDYGLHDHYTRCTLKKGHQGPCA
jgi:predicted Co/Zn/Cd cation transporter (cation efflux family)